ncbi:acyl-CoA-binding domain-containing protein 4 isoform X1 [Lycium ferocissimum]|uniref:acyl-CoA-binding domain-containing protein 4 isoform X1 n=2 Tax=Lycium ferocissimum TaxID=112874 RepID=UPI0028167FD9|nr:acyl-CoA-binding domain-containing protein 4 isoform X1 [Lycium ferocissimum]XP_059280641.1 acyl-CoA-binding domain-containing protein 4 isoform X1 [Lycium ferocissimum]
MFGFSKRRMKLGRLNSAQGTRSPMRQPKHSSSSSGEGVPHSNNDSEEKSCQCSSGAPELNNCASGGSENWMLLSIAGEKPTPRFNHAAAVVGNKMVVVGGETGSRLLEDVQVLNFDSFSWTTASSKLYLSPTSLPLKIPACKGHALVQWGKKILMVGGKTDPASDKISVWAFDIETECWSLLEAKGDVPVARSGHTVLRASSVLILFGGEDAKRRKLNDMHMFDLKSLTWLPLHCTGTGPSPRSNHVSALYDDKLLLIFGGSSKSRTLNDLYTLDFETMAWSRIKIRGFHPSPRAGCCGVLCGTKWYIAGGGSRKRRHAETLIFDVIKLEWSVAVASPASSITTNKGFSLVLVQHKERDFLVAFGGFKKDPSNEVEVLIMEKNELSMGRRSSLSKAAGNRLTSTGPASQPINSTCHVDSIARQNLASAVEHHGSGRKSLSESLLIDPSSVSGNVSLRKQFSNDEDACAKMTKTSGDESPSQEQGAKQLDIEIKTSSSGRKVMAEEISTISESEHLSTHHRQASGNLFQDTDDFVFQEGDYKAGLLASSGACQQYEAKISALMRKNGILEGQLEAALAGREEAEKKSTSALKSKQDMEKKMADAVREMELLKEKLASVELAQEEANSLSNIVHSDNVRLEHDVAFLKAVMDDTQKELHTTRGVLAGERARAFQLQVEVFHLKQRLQSLENRSPTPRKPFHV